MSWLKTAMIWGLGSALVGAVYGALTEPDELLAFSLAFPMLGVPMGLFFRCRDRLDDREDHALEMAAFDPSTTDLAPGWLSQLRSGGRVKIPWNFATLTEQGIEWRRLVGSSVNVKWCDVDSVSTHAISSRGIRSARMVYLSSKGKRHMINCQKKNFDDVLATCMTMVRENGGQTTPS